MPTRRATGKKVRKPRIQARQVTRSQVRKMVQAQKRAEREKTREKLARRAVGKFRVRKKDWGKLVLVGVRGGRVKDRTHKGYMVLIGPRGKKQLLRDVKNGYKPNKVGEFNVPKSKKTAKAIKAFDEKQVKRNLRGKQIVKGRASVKKLGGQFDFNDRTVNKLAKALRNVFHAPPGSKKVMGQSGNRNFLIRVAVLVELPDKTTETVFFDVPIAKPDHISIELGGLYNFIRLKFYSFMARELAFKGYVTAGSANHVRRLKENQGQDREDWTKDGQRWDGADNEVVRLRELQWEIVQL